MRKLSWLLQPRRLDGSAREPVLAIGLCGTMVMMTRWVTLELAAFPGFVSTDLKTAVSLYSLLDFIHSSPTHEYGFWTCSVFLVCENLPPVYVIVFIYKKKHGPTFYFFN